MRVGRTGLSVEGLRMDDQARPDPVARARELGTAIVAAAMRSSARGEFPTAAGRAPRIAAVPHAAAALGRRRAGRAWVYLRRSRRSPATTARSGWNMFVANSSALIAPFIPFEAARQIYSRSARPDLVGAAQPSQGDRRARRLPDHRRVAFLVGLSAGQLDRRAWSRRRARRLAASQSLRPADRAHPADAQPSKRRRSTTGTRSACAARRRNSLPSRTCSCPRPSPARARTRPAPRARAALRLHDAGPLRRRRVGRGTRHRARHARRLHRACREKGTAQPGAARRQPGRAVRRRPRGGRIGSARAYLVEILAAIYARADDVEPIDVADRARVRLACTKAIHGAIEVADLIYKSAGVDAIFLGTPFERRFRDIHTLSQQIQSRGAHFEAVGQVLLGMPPEPFF